MPLNISLSKLKEVTNQFTYATSGDSFEIENAGIVIDKFINSEIFWKSFVTPLTKRFNNNAFLEENVSLRENTSPLLQELAAYHYSIFKNIVYAYDCLGEKQMAFFENFYTHLTTICDLTDDFLCHLYFIIQQCEGNVPTLFKKLEKEDFLNLAVNYYDEKYSKDYDHYFSKGKIIPQRLINVSDILKVYFDKSEPRKIYVSTSKTIKEYRNVIIHNKQIGFILIEEKYFVPKINVIKKYKSWNEVSKVTKEIINNDFIEMKTQMQMDFDKLIECLNNLWAKPIHDLNALLYVENNPHLLNLYDLDLSENGSTPGNTHYGQLYVSGVSAISSSTGVSGSFTTSGANLISGIIDGSENPSHD